MTPFMWITSGLLTVQLGKRSASATRMFWQENTQRSFAFEKLTQPPLPTNDGTYIYCDVTSHYRMTLRLLPYTMEHSLGRVFYRATTQATSPSSVGFESIKGRSPRHPQLQSLSNHTNPQPQMSSSREAGSSSRGSSSSSSRSSTHLHKGSACLNCR